MPAAPLLLSWLAQGFVVWSALLLGPCKFMLLSVQQRLLLHCLFSLTVQGSEEAQKVLDMKGHPPSAFQKLRLTGSSSVYLLNY